MLPKLLVRDRPKTLILSAVKQCGVESVEDVLSVIEESLSVVEANQARAFLKWAFFDWDKRSFGYKNYISRYKQWFRYKQWLTSIGGKIRKPSVKKESKAIPVKGLVEILQEIHDEADHILGTEAKKSKEIVQKNSKAIKALAKYALKLLLGV
jgi:hypothetical protein